jgi:hypothetical protein
VNPDGYDAHRERRRVMYGSSNRQSSASAPRIRLFFSIFLQKAYGKLVGFSVAFR